MRAFANHVLKAEMLLDTPIAVSHGSLLAYLQKVYKPTAYKTGWLGLKALETPQALCSMMDRDKVKVQSVSGRLFYK